jgi:hypothetical protein
MATIKLIGLGDIDVNTIKEILTITGTTQAEWGKLCGVSESAVSHWLAGKHDAPQTATTTLEAVFFRHAKSEKWAYASMGTVERAKTFKKALLGDFHPESGKDLAWVAKVKPAAPARPAPVTGSYDELKDDDSWKDDAKKQFPDTPFYNFIDAARQAYGSSDIHTPMGPRISISIQTVHAILMKTGMTHDEALATAIHHVILARLPDGEYESVEPIWVAHFGKKIDKPAKHPEATNKEPGHIPFVRTYIRYGLIPWLYGDPGVGKSTAAKIVASELGRVYLRVPCNRYLTSEEMLGGMAAKDGTTFAQDGMITTLIRAVHDDPEHPGGIILLDEFSRLQPAMSTQLHSLMEMEELVVPLTGERIPIDRTRIGIIVADNTRGQAENPLFAGVEAVDEATRDRCVFIKVGYPPRGVERYIVDEAIKRVPNHYRRNITFFG